MQLQLDVLQDHISYITPRLSAHFITEYSTRLVDSFPSNVIAASNLVHKFALVNIESVQQISDTNKESRLCESLKRTESVIKIV